MQLEDRLILLLVQARESGGDAALSDLSALRAGLTRKAPDLHGEIQALIAALAQDVPGRIAAAPDPAVARADAAAEIARQERLPIAVVTPALAVAAHAASTLGMSRPRVEEEPWAGDSMVVGMPTPTPPPAASGPRLDKPLGFAPQYPAGFPNPHAGPHAPAPGPHYGHGAHRPPHAPAREPDPWNSYDMSGRPQPFYTKVWFFMLIGVLIVGGAVLFTQWNNLFGRAGGTPPPVQADAGPERKDTPPRTPPSAETLFNPGGPVLSRVEDGPFIAPQRAPDGRYGLSFSVPSDNGTIQGVLVLPTSWSGEGTLVGTANGARSVGGGSFVLDRGDGSAQARPVRRMRVQWRQDGVGAGATGVAVVGLPGQSDVALPGAAFCLMNDATGEAVACGQVR